MWSIGCIFGELFIVISKTVFPGISTANQIKQILELNGKPLDQDVDALESPLAAHILSSLNYYQKKIFLIILLRTKQSKRLKFQISEKENISSNSQQFILRILSIFFLKRIIVVIWNFMIIQAFIFKLQIFKR